MSRGFAFILGRYGNPGKNSLGLASFTFLYRLPPPSFPFSYRLRILEHLAGRRGFGLASILDEACGLRLACLLRDRHARRTLW